ncbi:hypothetical protein F5Y16DRAFT_420663 [Xylariaceae sp. FL0255]|nr:hypothetical protein F5Y16DRAFT_420663 [Xylariaceae sp. FL0255]
MEKAAKKPTAGGAPMPGAVPTPLQVPAPEEDDLRTVDGKYKCPVYPEKKSCLPRQKLQNMHWHVFKHHRDDYDDYKTKCPYDPPLIDHVNAKEKPIKCPDKTCAFACGLHYRVGMHLLFYHSAEEAQIWEDTPHNLLPTLTKLHLSKMDLEDMMQYHSTEALIAFPPESFDDFMELCRLVGQGLVDKDFGSLCIREANQITDELYGYWTNLMTSIGGKEKKELCQGEILQGIEFDMEMYRFWRDMDPELPEVNIKRPSKDDKVPDEKDPSMQEAALTDSWTSGDYFLLGMLHARNMPTMTDVLEYFKHIPADELYKIGRFSLMGQDAMEAYVRRSSSPRSVPSPEESPDGDANHERADQSDGKGNGKEKEKEVSNNIDKSKGNSITNERETHQPPLTNSQTLRHLAFHFQVLLSGERQEERSFKQSHYMIKLPWRKDLKPGDSSTATTASVDESDQGEQGFRDYYSPTPPPPSPKKKKGKGKGKTKAEETNPKAKTKEKKRTLQTRAAVKPSKNGAGPSVGAGVGASASASRKRARDTDSDTSSEPNDEDAKEQKKEQRQGQKRVAKKARREQKVLYRRRSGKSPHSE